MKNEPENGPERDLRELSSIPIEQDGVNYHLVIAFMVIDTSAKVE